MPCGVISQGRRTKTKGLIGAAVRHTTGQGRRRRANQPIGLVVRIGGCGDPRGALGCHRRSISVCPLGTEKLDCFPSKGNRDRPGFPALDQSKVLVVGIRKVGRPIWPCKHPAQQKSRRRVRVVFTRRDPVSKVKDNAPDLPVCVVRESLRGV